MSSYLPATNSSTKQSVTYEAEGKPATRVTGNSATFIAGYNDSNSLTSLTLSYSSGLQHDQLVYQYDPLARLTSASAASCVPATTTCSNWLTQFAQSYTYDPTLDTAGNLTSINYAGGGTTSLAYDADGNELTESRSNPGLNLAYTYDYADRPITLTATKGSATTNFVTAASYEPFGPMTSLSYGNGTTQTRMFTQRYLPLEFKTTNSSGAVLNDLTYTEFGTGQIATITDQLNGNYS